MKRYLAGLEALTKNEHIEKLTKGFILKAKITEGISLPYKAVVSLLLPVMFSVDEINSMMRKEVLLTLEVNADDLDQSRKRVFPGIISSVSYKGKIKSAIDELELSESKGPRYQILYELVIEPHLSLASKEPRTLLYKDRKNVKEVIKGILKDRYLLNCEFDIEGSGEENDDLNTVLSCEDFIFQQTEETDLDYIKRLCSIFCLNFQVSVKEESPMRYVESVKFMRDTVYPADNAVIDRNIICKQLKLNGKEWKEPIPVKDTLKDGDDYFSPFASFEGFVSNNDFSESGKDESSDYKYLINYAQLPSLLREPEKPVIKVLEKLAISHNKATSYCSEVKGLLSSDNLLFVPGVPLSFLDETGKTIFKDNVISRTAIECTPQIKNKYVYEDNELKEKNSSLKVNFVVTPICFDKAVAKFVHYSRYNFTDSLNDALKIEKVQLHGTDEKSKGDGLCIVEGEVCDSEGKTDRKNARNIDTVGQTDSSSASSFYVLLKDSSKSVVVAQFMTPEGSDLKSGITPRIGEKVFLVKQGSKYYFMGYRPYGFGEPVQDRSISDGEMDSTGIYKKNLDGTVSEPFKCINFKSGLEKLKYLIVAGGIKEFVLHKDILLNEYYFEVKFNEETFKGCHKNFEAAVNLYEACEQVKKNLENARKLYSELRGEDSKEQREELKAELSDCFADLGELAAAIQKLFKAHEDPDKVLTDITSDDSDIMKTIDALMQTIAELGAATERKNATTEENAKKEFETRCKKLQTRLETELNKLKGSKVSQDKVAELQKLLDDLKNSGTSNQEDIKKSRDSIKAINEKINEIEKQKKEMSNRGNDITAVNNEIEKLKNERNSLDSRLKALESKGPESDSKKIEEFKNKINDLEQNIVVNGQLLAIKSEDEISLSAKKISIDAGDSFTIKCKDSTISIDNEGTVSIIGTNEVSTKCGTGAVSVKDDDVSLKASIFNNTLQPWTSNLSVNSLSGIKLNGPSVNVSSITGFTATDYWGATFKLSYGNITSTGIKCSMGSVTPVDLGWHAMSGIKYIADGITSIAAAGKDKEKAKKIVNSCFNGVYSVLNDIKFITKSSYKNNASTAQKNIAVAEGIALIGDLCFNLNNLILECMSQTEKFKYLAKKGTMDKGTSTIQKFKMAQWTLAILSKLPAWASASLFGSYVGGTSAPSLTVNTNSIKFAAAEVTSAFGINGNQQAEATTKITADYGKQLAIGTAALAGATVIGSVIMGCLSNKDK